MKTKETDSNLFNDVCFLIEANSTEQHLLWYRYHHSSDAKENKIELWDSLSLGYMIEIGHVAGRPICVSINYAILNGKKIAFYYGCSQLVDHKMIKEWLEDNCPELMYYSCYKHKQQCDADNFMQFLDFVNK